MRRLSLHVMEAALRQMQQCEFTSHYGGQVLGDGWLKQRERLQFNDPFGDYRIEVHSGSVSLSDPRHGISWKAYVGIRKDDMVPAIAKLDVDFEHGNFDYLSSAHNRRTILYQAMNALCRIDVYGVDMPVSPDRYTLKSLCDAARRSGHRRRVRTASHYIEQVLTENRSWTVHPANRRSELRYIQVAATYLGAQADGRSGRKAVEERFCPGKPGQSGSLISRAQQAGYLAEPVGRGPGAVRGPGPKFNERWLAA